jgi:hypothetical protein
VYVSHTTIMRVFIVLGAIALASGLSLRNTPANGNQNKQEHADAIQSGNSWGTNDLNDTSGDDEANQTPFVRQHGNMWQGVVPNYEGGEPKQFTNLFSSEGEAKAWVYSKTGAEEPLMYATPPGADDSQEGIIKQVVKEGSQANNSNRSNENDQTGELERPIIDADLSHRANQSYHDTYDHMSTIKASGVEHGETHETEATKNALWKAKRAKEWSKSVSGRAHDNGVNSGLNDEAEEKTQGAGDAADKKSKELQTLGKSHPKAK